MAEAPPARGGSILTKKWHGIPVPVLAVGGGVALILGYRWWKGRQSSSASTTPTGDTGAGVGLGYPMGPSGVIGGGLPSTGPPIGPVLVNPTSTSGAPPTDMTQPTTVPQAATVSTLGVPLPGFPSSQPVLGTNVGARPGQLLVGLPGGAGASYTLAPAGTTAPAQPGYSPSLGKIISAKDAIPGEQYQAVPGQPGMLQVIT